MQRARNKLVRCYQKRTCGDQQLRGALSAARVPTNPCHTFARDWPRCSKNLLPNHDGDTPRIRDELLHLKIALTADGSLYPMPQLQQFYDRSATPSAERNAARERFAKELITGAAGQ